MKKSIFAILAAFMVVAIFVACADDAVVARSNLERSEQNFELYRRVVFYNGINGWYILTIDGRLAIIVDSDGDLVVTVKTDNGEYLKHYLGLSDNVTYFSEQLESKNVSASRYRVIFKPSTIIPNIDLK